MKLYLSKTFLIILLLLSSLSVIAYYIGVPGSLFLAFLTISVISFSLCIWSPILMIVFSQKTDYKVIGKTIGYLIPSGLIFSLVLRFKYQTVYSPLSIALLVVLFVVTQYFYYNNKEANKHIKMLNPIVVSGFTLNIIVIIASYFF